jgi:hypothetical protein
MRGFVDEERQLMSVHNTSGRAETKTNFGWVEKLAGRKVRANKRHQQAEHPNQSKR